MNINKQSSDAANKHSEAMHYYKGDGLDEVGPFSSQQKAWEHFKSDMNNREALNLSKERNVVFYAAAKEPATVANVRTTGASSLCDPIVATVPGEWKLVPIYPNQEMINAFVAEYHRPGGSERACYTAMINAAPISTAEQASDADERMTYEQLFDTYRGQCQLTDELAAKLEAGSDKALLARIAELESDLAEMNKRYIAAPNGWRADGMPLEIRLSLVNENTQWNAVSNKSTRIVVSQKTPQGALQLALIDADMASKSANNKGEA